MEMPEPCKREGKKLLPHHVSPLRIEQIFHVVGMLCHLCQKSTPTAPHFLQKL